jgi:hypothetical protein
MNEDDFLNELSDHWTGREYRFESWVIIKVDADLDDSITYTSWYIDEGTQIMSSSCRRTVKKSVLRECIRRFNYERIR